MSIEKASGQARAKWGGFFWVVALLALPLAARGQSGPRSAGTPGREPERSAPTFAPIREQKALDLLKRMSETLAGAKAFTYRSRGAIELRAKTGQFVTLFGDSEVALERPNKLYVRVTGEVPNFQLYYDGREVTAYAPKDNVYSVSSAPNTIDEMLDFVQKKAKIHFPSSDLMAADPYAALARDLSSGFVVGPATVDGSPCEHLAFRARESNWEIWIDNKSALPRRLLVTYTRVADFPRLAVEFSSWDLAPKLPKDRFDFTTPPGAKRVEFQPVSAENGPQAP